MLEAFLNISEKGQKAKNEAVSFPEGFEVQVKTLVQLASVWGKEKSLSQKPILVLAKNMLDWYDKKCKIIEGSKKGQSQCLQLKKLCDILLVIELIGK